MNEEMVAQVFNKLGVIEGKQDLTLERLEGFDRRIRSLERFRAKLLGIFAAVSVLVGAAWSWTKDRLFRSPQA